MDQCADPVWCARTAACAITAPEAPIRHWLKRAPALLALGWVLSGTPAHAQDPDPEVTWATYQQEVLVGWSARAETATRRADARAAFFAGTTGFAEGFPSLVGARLESPAIVRGRLVALQDRATAREGERQTPFPPLGSPAREEEARAARARALEAEDRADALLRRVLAGIEAHLKRHPELAEDGLAKLRAPLLAITEEGKTPAANPEQQEALDLRVARADQDLASLDALQRALVLHAVAERPLPDAQPDIALLGDEARAPFAAARLQLLQPWLRDAEREAVDAALAGWARGPALEQARTIRAAAAEAVKLAGTEPLGGTVDDYTARVAEAQAALDHATAELVELPPDAIDRERRAVELETLADRLRVAQIHLDRAQGQRDGVLDAATAAADRARKQAQEAAANAADDEERARARFLGEAADARDRVREVAETLDTRRAAVADATRVREEKLTELSGKLTAIEKASPLPGSGPDADEVYREVRRIRNQLIDGAVARGEVVSDASDRLAEVSAASEKERATIAKNLARLDDPASTAAGEDWRAALDSEREITQGLLDVAQEERQNALTALQRLAEVRRGLRSYVSWEEREKDRRDLGADVVRELRLLGPTIMARVSKRGQELLEVPYRLFRDATLLVDFAWGMFWLVVLLGAWRWARGKSADLASRAAVQVKRIKPDLRPIDAQRLKGPAGDAIRAGIDLTLGYLMVGRISPLSPEIAFLVEAWLLIAIYRALLATFDLAVVRAPEFRPSLIALSPGMYDLARFSTRVVIVWGIARGFTYYVLWSMLQLDTVAGLAMTVFNLIGFLLLLGLLYRWDPILRERVKVRNQDSKLVAFLSREVPRPFRALSALGLLTFFAVTLSVDLVYMLLARDRTGLARLFNVITRYQMGAEQDVSLMPIPREVTDALCARNPEEPVYVARPGLDESLDSAYQGWKKDGRRGMVALVGDRGEGKRTEIARFLKRLSEDEIPDLRCRLDHVIVDEREILHWLAEVVGVAPADTAEELVANLRGLPRSLVVIEQAHRAYSRTVGGFSAFSQLLYVLNATSDHHFWLVTFHRPAWRYLSAVPSIVDVGVFRGVVSLEPFDANMLRDLTVKRARKQGIELDYRGLMRANLLGADPEVEQERATNAFYRLLSEASEGNPRVAMHLFSACLEPGERSGLARVLTRKALSNEVVADLSVDALFTLTALRQQDSMQMDDIVEVTNLPVHAVRNTVRDLQSRGLVEDESDQIYIPIENLPLVSRTLRRRHLLYLGA
ncbi:MAG: hypothetical protein R3F61_07885 [Myxococcota bacterium]